MPPEVFDPQKASQSLTEARGGQPSAAEVATLRRRRRASGGPPRDPTGDPLRDDFRVFLTAVWRFLALPDPTPLQLAIAHLLQHSKDPRLVLMAFRGAAKSWITAAFCLWLLYCDPQKRILVVSASLTRATLFVQFCLALIQPETGLPELRHLAPKPHQRQSGQAFDVGPARPDQSPSLKAAGITGQITGSRADAIVPDDVEIPQNSMTVLMREKLAEAVKEFDAIIKPGGIIRFLGTPQSDDSVYNKLAGRGYRITIFPARFPDRQQQATYGDRLAPYIRHQLRRDRSLVGKSTEPSRFSDDDLAKRELSWGKSGFGLQFMLDTTLSDAGRYPLKLRDLIVMHLDPLRGPDHVAWGNAEDLVLQGLPNLGFEGDRWYGPANVSETFSKWERVVATVDPSGRGDDETSAAVGAKLHGRLFLLAQGAWRDGYSPATLQAIAAMFVRWGVHEAIIESDFGDGTFLALLRPYVEEAWREANKRRRRGEEGGTKLTEVRAKKQQKELRILDVMEPITQGHRLVVNQEAIEQDYASLRRIEGEETRHRYSLWYQYTHVTRERGALKHEDRLEALSMLGSHFAVDLGVNPEVVAHRRQEERWEEEMEKLFGEADEVATGRRGPRPSARPKAARRRMRT